LHSRDETLHSILYFRKRPFSTSVAVAIAAAVSYKVPDTTQVEPGLVAMDIDATPQDRGGGDPAKQSPNQQPHGVKRQMHTFPEMFRVQAKKFKKAPYPDGGGGMPSASPSLSLLAPKNAVVTLNEIKPGLEFAMVEQRGPVHDPVFVIEVAVNGEKFKGEGR
jgi:hypothetical protein